MERLNKIAEDPEKAERPRYDEMIGLLRTGFDNGHVYCHSWMFFPVAIGKYPTDRKLAIMHLRYSAIYAEESDVFQFAANNLRNLKPGPLQAKPLLHQVKWPLQRRERGFSKHLRETISRVMERTEECGRQVRQIWECIIQRQIKHVNCFTRALKSDEHDILDGYRKLC
jgi:hypothetical protein